MRPPEFPFPHLYLLRFQRFLKNIPKRIRHLVADLRDLPDIRRSIAHVDATHITVCRFMKIFANQAFRIAQGVIFGA